MSDTGPRLSQSVTDADGKKHTVLAATSALLSAAVVAVTAQTFPLPKLNINSTTDANKFGQVFNGKTK